ncbi:MAG: YihY/virulence factor BrkB family protein [Rickettsiaceae bacterium]|jgi:membrane protein|nr:YihY/virulence factor BrkB family protein [Rickettsiaceae bacterium]
MKSKLFSSIKRNLFLFWQTLYNAIRDTIKQDGIEHAGYLSFLSILSLFPFLIFLFSIITYFGDSEICKRIIYVILNSFPTNISKSLLPRINEIVNGPPQGLLTIAIIGIIWTASSAVEGLRTILNRAYRVQDAPHYLQGRMLSIAQFIIITLIVSFTLIILVLVPAILKKLEMIFFVSFKIDYDWFYFRHLIIFFVLFITTSLLYYYIADAKQKYSDTIAGTLVAIGLWTIILQIFSLYLEKFNQFNLVYGSLGGIIGTLMFFYLVNLVFIIGAEFNYHFKLNYSKK